MAANLQRLLKELSNKIRFKNFFICTLLFILTFITRIAIVPGHNGFSSYDAGNFLLATQSYSIQNDRPHVPGYYLYVVILKDVNLIINDNYYSMLFLSVLLTSLAGIFIFLLLKKYFVHYISFLLTLIIIFNPYVWYFSLSTEIYSFDIFFSALIFYTGIQRNGIYFLPLLIALGAGVRQSSALLLLPLCFYLFYLKLKNKDIDWILLVVSIVPAVLAFLLWFIPMTNSTGGIAQYIELMKSRNNLRQSIFSIGLSGFVKNMVVIASYGFYVIIPAIVSFIIILIYKLSKKKKGSSISDNTQSFATYSHFSITFIELCFWLIPPILFYLIIHNAKGYLLLIFPIIIIVPAFFLFKKFFSQKELLIIIVVQIAFFFLYPSTYPHYELNANYNYRKLSKVQISLIRLTSVYSMSYSHLNQLKTYYSEIDEIIKKTKFNKNLYLLIDPTVVPTHRILQVIYPDITFVMIYQQYYDKYSIYQGISYTDYYGIENVLYSSAIITSNSFYNKFLKDFSDKSYSTEHFTAFIPSTDKVKTIAEFYRNYFNREGYSFN
jgi:hypothetical protein